MFPSSCMFQYYCAVTDGRCHSPLTIRGSERTKGRGGMWVANKRLLRGGAVNLVRP